MYGNYALRIKKMKKVKFTIIKLHWFDCISLVLAKVEKHLTWVYCLNTSTVLSARYFCRFSCILNTVKYDDGCWHCTALHTRLWPQLNLLTSAEWEQRANDEDCRLMTSLMHDVNIGSHGNENNCRRVQRRFWRTWRYTRTTADGRYSFSLVYNTGVNPAAMLGHVVSRGGRVLWCIKMIDGGTFGLASGIVAGRRSSSSRARTSSRLPRRANHDSDHQNNANFFRSRCDRVSMRATRRFSFDLWPLFGDTDIGLVQLLQADGYTFSSVSQQLQQPFSLALPMRSTAVVIATWSREHCLSPPRFVLSTSRFVYATVRAGRIGGGMEDRHRWPVSISFRLNAPLSSTDYCPCKQSNVNWRIVG